MKNEWLRKMLFGFNIPNEYLGVDPMSLLNEIKVYASNQSDSKTVDVTSSCLFMGYSPVIIGIYCESGDTQFDLSNGLCLSFAHRTFSSDAGWRGFRTSSLALARLVLKHVTQRALGEQTLHIYEVTWGVHTFLSAFHRWMGRLRQSLYRAPSNNVNLPGNRYEQVRILYSIPRIIALISLGDQNKFNLFPTDLHGHVGKNCYVDSLRIKGKANQQVSELKKIVLSEVRLDFFKKTYALGKNHVKDLQEVGHFPFLPALSEIFKLPIPNGAIRYRELLQVGSQDIGIHRLHFFTIVHEKEIEATPSLSCVHRYYVQWRLDNNLPITFLP